MAPTTTARDVTAALRSLWPAPVRLSTTGNAPTFLVRLPSSPAASWRNAAGSYEWMEGFLSRHLGGQPVAIHRNRAVRCRDGGHDVEFAVTVGAQQRCPLVYAIAPPAGPLPASR